MKRKFWALAQQWDHITAKYNSTDYTVRLHRKIKLSHLEESPQTTMWAQLRLLLAFGEM